MTATSVPIPDSTMPIIGSVGITGPTATLIHTDAPRIRVGVNAIFARNPASTTGNPHIMSAATCSTRNRRPIGYWCSAAIGCWNGTGYIRRTAATAQRPEQRRAQAHHTDESGYTRWQIPGSLFRCCHHRLEGDPVCHLEKRGFQGVTSLFEHILFRQSLPLQRGSRLFLSHKKSSYKHFQSTQIHQPES